MELLLYRPFSWFDLVVAAVLLYGIYALLYLAKERLERSKRVVGVRATAYRIIAPFLLLYQPLTVLILATIFVFINPLVHGLLLLIVATAGFSRIRDYLSGRVILFNPLVTVGKRLRTSTATGVISRISRIGLYLQTAEGLHFINYTTLLTEGYSLITGKNIGGYYQLILTPPPERDHPMRDLLNRLTTTPYLDRSFRPELSPAKGGESDRIHARISVREEQHLSELLGLIGEWGYTAQVGKR
jgi:hypothetical protein